jgi:hypothetical protein
LQFVSFVFFFLVKTAKSVHNNRQNQLEHKEGPDQHHEAKEDGRELDLLRVHQVVHHVCPPFERDYLKDGDHSYSNVVKSHYPIKDLGLVEHFLFFQCNSILQRISAEPISRTNKNPRAVFGAHSIDIWINFPKAWS